MSRASIAAPAPTKAVDATPAPLEPRRDALRDIRAVSPGIVPFGVVLGITAASEGNAFAGVLGALTVFGGSAQLATMTTLHLGSGLLAAVAGGIVVNARLLLYAIALEPRFRGQPGWFRVLAPQLIQDQTYLSTIARTGYQGSEFRRYWAWLGGVLLLVWTAAVGLGAVVGPSLPDMPHLVLVATTMFMAMLVPRLVAMPAVVGALTAAVAAAAAAQVAPQLAVLVGTLVGVSAGVRASSGRRAS